MLTVLYKCYAANIMVSLDFKFLKMGLIKFQLNDTIRGTLPIGNKTRKSLK